MNLNDIYTLEERGIIYINGADAKEFLQNIVTNDVEKITENSSVFSSLLTPQGKYLFDFIIVKHKNGFFLDCEKSQLLDLFGKLNVYKLRSKVEFLDLSNEFVVAVLSRDKFLSLENTLDIEGHTIKFREDTLFLDPRNKRLGARLIINLEKLYLSIKKLNLKPNESGEYYKFSHQLGIPQIGCNKLQDKIFGIECNFDELNGIDFKKGCYVGQENTARIKLKNKQSKKLFSLKVLSGDINVNEEIKQKNKLFGKVLINQDYPFGIIKFKDTDIKIKNEFECGNAKIKVIIPDWLNVKVNENN